MEESQTPISSESVAPNVEGDKGQNLLKKVNFPSSFNLPLILLTILIVLAGVATGWFLSGGKVQRSKESGIPASVQTAKEAGVKDETAFRDSAEGVLRQGGINGEGTHHLERDGGPSQYVYLTSSVIDLSAFEGKKVKVWGETISAAKAGWFMDVGRVKVIE